MVTDVPIGHALTDLIHIDELSASYLPDTILSLENVKRIKQTSTLLSETLKV